MSRASARSAAPWVLLAGGATLAAGMLWASRARASTVPRILEASGPPLLPGEAEDNQERLTELMLSDEPGGSDPKEPEPLPLAPDELDVEAGARMIASENPRGSRRLHIEQLWTQIRSAKPRQSLYDRITAGSGWGPQGASKPPGRVRPVATGQRANDAQRQLVRAVLRGSEPSTLEGARKFFEPAVQDRAFAIGERARAKKAAGEGLTKQEQRLLHYKRTAAVVRAGWSKDSHVVGTIDGVEFWT